jgi:hypothetical protein
MENDPAQRLARAMENDPVQRLARVMEMIRLIGLLRRGFHYYLWLYSSIGNGALASHI